MWLTHNTTLQISGTLEHAGAELRKILGFFRIEPPKHWTIDGEGKLAFRFGSYAAQNWHPASELTQEALIQKIMDYLEECANRSPMLRDGGFLLRWIPQGGYDRVNRVCGGIEPADYDWDGGFTVEPWDRWKGRVFRFSYYLEPTAIDEILVFAQAYLGMTFNGETCPLPGGGFALGRYGCKEIMENPLLRDNEAERGEIARYMKRVLPGQQEISGLFCDEESCGFLLDYAGGQEEGQDMLLVRPYVCFCHK